MTTPTLLSLGEIDALCLKAARGAGFSWGMAQEAGRAARMLAAWKLPGPEALAAHLNEIDGAVDQHAPVRDGKGWSCAAGAHCPISLGAALADFAHVLSDRPTILGAVHRPLLLPPFLRAVAEQRMARVVLQGGSDRLNVGPLGPEGRPDAPSRWHDVRIFLAPLGDPSGPVITTAPYPIDSETLAALTDLAHRTYVPATEESRRSGAGAGPTDND